MEILGKTLYFIIGDLFWIIKIQVDLDLRNIQMKQEKISLSIRGDKNPMYGKTHTPEAIKKIFSYRKMNKTEKIVADLLDQQKIPYEFQFFITDNSICKSYDFKLKDRPVIIEVDGDFWHGGPGSKTYWKDVDKVKLNDVLKESIAKTKGYKLLRFWESDLKKDVNIILQYL